MDYSLMVHVAQFSGHEGATSKGLDTPQAPPPPQTKKKKKTLSDIPSCCFSLHAPKIIEVIEDDIRLRDACGSL